MYHGNLTVLVHPNSGRPKVDHLLNAFWMRSILPLDGIDLAHCHATVLQVRFYFRR